MAAIYHLREGFLGDPSYSSNTGTNPKVATRVLNITIPAGLQNSTLIIAAVVAGTSGDQNSCAISSGVWCSSGTETYFQYESRGGLVLRVESGEVYVTGRCSLSLWRNPSPGAQTVSVTCLIYDTGGHAGIAAISAYLVSNVGETPTISSSDFDTSQVSGSISSANPGDISVISTYPMADYNLYGGYQYIQQGNSGSQSSFFVNNGNTGLGLVDQGDSSIYTSWNYTANGACRFLVLPGLPDPFIHVPLSFFG